MTTTTALIFLTLAGLLYIVGGVYANHRLRKWMAAHSTERKESNV